jgi:hypothetical protein
MNATKIIIGRFTGYWNARAWILSDHVLGYRADTSGQYCTDKFLGLKSQFPRAKLGCLQKLLGSHWWTVSPLTLGLDRTQGRRLKRTQGTPHT